MAKHQPDGRPRSYRQSVEFDDIDSHPVQAVHNTLPDWLTSCMTRAQSSAAELLLVGLLGIALLVVGTSLRLNQWSAQVLADDEWHALLWISKYSASRTFLEFGVSDHSIPMALYDILVSQFTPLNEVWMRAPSLIAGILLIVVSASWLIRHDRAWEALTLTGLLSVSPTLVYFSRIARPYALSLLLAYLAHWAFWKYWERPHYKWLLLYGLGGAVATWLLSLAGFFVIAPLAYVMPQLFAKKTASTAWPKALRLALAFGVAAGVVLIPPLLASLDDLSAKAGKDMPTLDTWVNIWFTWFGTRSSLLVLVFLAFACLGAPSLLRQLVLARSALVGCCLVLAAIYVAQPAESFRTITFGRYMLFALPLILTSISFGLVRFVTVLAWPRWTTGALVAALLIAIYKTSHLPEQVQTPNSYTLTAYYYMEPRPEKNPSLRTMGFPMSKFWPMLKSSEQPVRVAVAPYYFESYYWPVVRWTHISEQEILPLFINGFCVPDHHPGEPPFIERTRIKLKNGIYLAEANIEPDLFKKNKIDWIVWQKKASRPEVPYNPNFARCDKIIPQALGKPDFEDQYLMAFRVK